VSVCKDCLEESGVEVNGVKVYPLHLRPRPIVKAGRCATHARIEKRRQLEQSHRRRIKSQYGLQDGQYEALYEAQGRKCAICQRATGASRRLSVDHDHKSMLVRGLLCRPCNSMLGHGRDNPEFFRRAVKYLSYPPAFDAIGEVKPSETE
jgi:hypothetical protein